MVPRETDVTAQGTLIGSYSDRECSYRRSSRVRETADSGLAGENHLKKANRRRKLKLLKSWKEQKAV